MYLSVLCRCVSESVLYAHVFVYEESSSQRPRRPFCDFSHCVSVYYCEGQSACIQNLAE